MTSLWTPAATAVSAHYADQNQTFNDHCNAWGGWKTGDFLTGVTGSAWGAGRGDLASWLQQDTPDLVLLHIGTNDSWAGEAAATYFANLAGMITLLQSSNSNVVILLAKIIPFGSALAATAGAQVPIYNAQMDAFAAAKSTATSPIITVDQYTGYVPDVDNACDTRRRDDGSMQAM